MHNLTWEEKIEASLEGLVKSCKAMLERIEKLEDRVQRSEDYIESFELARIAPAKSAADNTLESLSALADDELPADTGLIPVVLIMDESAPPPSLSPSEPSSTLEVESSMCKIAEAVSKRQGTPLPERDSLTPGWIC